MTKEEIKKVAEEMIEAQCDESGCVREEVLEVSTFCFLEQYIRDEITKEDLIELSEYLETPLDMEEVEKLKVKRKKQAEYRFNHKARKLIERKKKKFEGQRFEGNGLNMAIGMAIFDEVVSGKITEELWLKACEFLGLRDKDFELKKCKKEEK